MLRRAIERYDSLHDVALLTSARRASGRRPSRLLSFPRSWDLSQEHPCLQADVREAIAQAIHKEYVAHYAGRDTAGDPALASWNQLPLPLQESNRQQADHICHKLARIGCAVVTASKPHTLHEFSTDEIELLAEMEHERWMAERRRDGWKWGPVRDPDRRVSPYLISWHRLPDDVRETDRQAVRSIPRLLSLVGLAAASISEANASPGPMGKENN